MNLTPIFSNLSDVAALLWWLGTASAQAAVLVIAVLALRALLGPRLSPAWRLALWLIVALRLVVPIAVESQWSLPGLARRAVDPRPVPAAVVASRDVAGPRVTVAYGPVPTDAIVKPVTPVAPVNTVAAGTHRANRVTSLAAIWLAGVVTLVAWQLVRGVWLRRAVARMRTVDDAEVVALAAAAARAVGVRRRVRIVGTERVRCPAVCGIVWPVVLLPVDAQASMSRDELRLVLMHEFVHVRRDDVLAGAVARLIVAMHWFNPLAWLAARAYRADRELACDAAVLARLADRGERQAYGACVLDVVERLRGSRRPHPASLGLFGPGRSLRRRIEMIADRSQQTSFQSRAGRWIAGAIACVAVGCAAAAGERAASGPTSTKDAVKTGGAVLTDGGDVPADAGATALARKVDVASFAATPLADALDAAAAKAGTTLRVDWDALARAGVDRRMPVTLSVKNVTLGKALDLLLGQAKAATDYEFDRGAIVVSTPEAIARDFGETRTYPLPAMPGGEAERAEVAKQLVTLVTDTIDSESWAGSKTGGRGTLVVRGEQLVVVQTPRRQAQVAELLAKLAAQRDRSNAPPPLMAASQPADDSVRAALDAPMGGDTFNLDASPLRDALDFFRDHCGVPIFVNWTAIEAAGIDQKTPVTLRLPGDVRRRKALSLMLDAAGGGVARLGWAVDDGVVTVSTQDDLAKNVGTRTYDIRDLLVAIPDFESFGATSRPTAATPTREEAVQQLITLITSSVAADTWKVNGGLIGSIQELGGQLIVTQTPENQAEIVALLKAIRGPRAVQVLVEPRFLSADPALVSTLIGKDGGSSAFLDDSQVVALARATPNTATLIAPKLTLFNGQQAFVKVATPQPYIANYVMSQTAAGERRFEPQTVEAESGVIVDVQATASADRKSVTLTLSTRVTRLVRVESVPFAGDPAAKLTVQRPILDTQVINTTVSVPDRGTVLLAGGMISDGDLRGGRGAATQPTTRQLLLLVKPTVIVQRETDENAPQR